MLDILKFVFSSFWIWLGATIMLAVGIEGMWKALLIVISTLRGR